MLVLALAVALVTEWAVISVSADVPCAPRSYGPTRMVCVCNSTHCDTVDKPTPLPEGQFLWYTSNRGGLRFHKDDGELLTDPCTKRYLVHCSGTLQDYVRVDIPALLQGLCPFTGPGEYKLRLRPSRQKLQHALPWVRLHVTRSNEYQAVVGFGGAFTDAAGINVLSLSPQAQDNLLKSYFSPEGLEFNIGRVPIAGCDFSTHTYSYDNIPLIKRAQEFGNKSLLLLAGAWSPPPWMKTNNDYSGFGFLKEEYLPDMGRLPHQVSDELH
uniref:Glucosylceramidase n=1 Tax=Timema cristinae TaxID=61476 RepID=A0A7R9DJE1_TIMCR|nr:unnamed protein product [Timema cristinae]